MEINTRVIRSLSQLEVEAIDSLCDVLLQRWDAAGVKKSTEFDTVWALAEKEGAKRFKNIFIQSIYAQHDEKFSSSGQE